MAALTRLFDCCLMTAAVDATVSVTAVSPSSSRHRTQYRSRGSDVDMSLIELCNAAAVVRIAGTLGALRQGEVMRPHIVGGGPLVSGSTACIILPDV